jgi:hypothetical protein
MCLRRRRLCWVGRHRRLRIGAVKEPPLVAVVVLHFRTVIALVTEASVAGWAAAEACQDVLQLLGRQHLGGGCGWARHMVSERVGAVEQVGVVEVRFLAVGSVVAASGLVEARIGAVHHPEAADSAVAVAVAREVTKEEVGTIDLPVEARSIAVGHVVVGLSRVSCEGSGERDQVEVPYALFSGGATLSQPPFSSSFHVTHEDKSSRPAAVAGFRGILTCLMRLEALRMDLVSCTFDVATSRVQRRHFVRERSLNSSTEKQRLQLNI